MQIKTFYAVHGPQRCEYYEQTLEMSHSLPQSQWPILSFVTARATKHIYIPYGAFAWHWGAWWFLCGRCGAKKTAHLHVLGADL